MIDSRDSDALSAELAWLVLERVAPEELMIFHDTADEYFADRQSVLDARAREETLGFGLDIALLTPYVLAVAGSVVTWLGGTIVDVARDESKAAISGWVRLLFRRNAAASRQQVRPLSAAQARTIREIAFVKSTEFGLARGQAGLIADAIVGAMMVDPRVT